MDVIPEPRRRHRRNSAKPNLVRQVVLIICAFVVLALAWLGVSGYFVVQHLMEAQKAAHDLKSGLESGDTHLAESAADRFESSATTAHNLSRDFVWELSSLIPFVGPNISAVATAATAADLLGREGIPALAPLRTAVNPSALKPVNGKIDFSTLEAARPSAQAGAQAFEKADSLLSSIDPAPLFPQLASQVDQVQAQVHQVASLVSTVNAVAQLAPEMLGANGPRNYIVMVQNSAEARATGGIAGALALIASDDGQISLQEQASTADFPQFVPPVMTLPTGTHSLFGNQPAQLIQDVNYTPDFSLSGQLVQKMWNIRFGTTADGVISIDPIALSYILEATGPLKLVSGEELNSANAVQLLLSDVYSRYSLPTDQDAFFASVASQVFHKIASGDFDGDKFISALARSGQEHRVFLWNSEPGFQDIIQNTTLGSLLPESTSRTSGFGLYFNDQTGSKMDTFLDVSIEQTVSLCRNDRRPVFDLTVDMTNTAPADAAQSLPKYVTGGGVFGTEPGSIRTQLLAYGPQNGAWQPAVRDGVLVESFSTVTGSFLADVLEVNLKPGETSQIHLTFIGNPGVPSRMSILATPLPRVNISETNIHLCQNAVG